MATKLKRRVHLFGGDKGGVGKTFVCRTCIQFFLDKGIQFTPVEADRYNPDVANRYQSLPFEYAIFSEDEAQTRADEVVEWAKSKSVLISLPSQVGRPLGNWLEDAVETAARYDIQFVYWFVSSGAYESLDLLNEALKRHGKMMPFVLVCNHGVGEEWDVAQVEGLSGLIKAFDVKVVDFPKLPIKERNLLDKNNLTLGDARTAALFKRNSMSKDRIEKFLRKAYSSFDRTGLMA